MIFPPEVDRFWRFLEGQKNESDTVDAKPLEHRSVQQVSLPQVSAEGHVDAAVRQATTIAASLVDEDPDSVSVDKAEIKDVKSHARLEPNGRLETEQVIKLELTVRVKKGARLALGASSSFLVDGVEVVASPKVQELPKVNGEPK